MSKENLNCEQTEHDFIDRVKLKLMEEINKYHIKSKNTQSETAKLLKISQPKFSNIHNYHISKFSVENLINLNKMIGNTNIFIQINGEKIRF